MTSTVVTFLLVSEQPDIPFYGLFIPIFALALLALWGLNTLHSSYKKKLAIKRLERERYITDGVMIVCANCGMETMMNCPSCGKQLVRKVLHCPTCGKPVEK